MWVEPTDCAVVDPGDDGAARAQPLFVVINPGSGKQDGAPTRELLARVFEEAGRPAYFADVATPVDLPRSFHSSAARARNEGGVLVAVGGDGTVNAAAEAALEHDCPLGIIPRGTFNLLARDHGIPVDAEAAARALLRAKIGAAQVGLVNGKLFHLSASLGLYPQLLQDREAFTQQFGRRPWVAVISALVTLFKWRRQMLLDIELDGQRTTMRTPTLFVANNRLQLERLGIEEAVLDGLQRSRLVGLVIRPIGSWAMLGLVLRGALGRLGEADQVHGFTFHRLDVNVRSARRVRISADGEVGRMGLPLCFSVSPRPLLLMLPSEEDRVARE